MTATNRVQAFRLDYATKTARLREHKFADWRTLAQDRPMARALRNFCGSPNVGAQRDIWGGPQRGGHQVTTSQQMSDFRPLAGGRTLQPAWKRNKVRLSSGAAALVRLVRSGSVQVYLRREPERSNL